MRLKEIKPNTAIHCTSKEQIRCLVDSGIVEDHYKEFELPIWVRVNGNGTCGWMPELHPKLMKGKDYYEKEGCICVEFSDLIISDPELSAEEALLAYDQMCRENYCCNDCPIYGILGHECAHKMDGHITEIVNAIKKWKADREKKGPETEKKEPEIEWVFKGVADIVGCNEIEFFVSEEAAREWCERRTLETGNNHAYVPVCRVKAVE